MIDLGSALLVLAVLTVCAFAMFLPFWAVTKDKELALKFVIPVSISVEVIIGYIFYSFNIVKYYPFVLLGVCIVINILAWRKIKPRLNLPRFNIRQLIFPLIVIIALFFTRYFDAFTHLAPGAKDTFVHYTFLEGIKDYGRINLGYYAPGFHLFLFPLLILSSGMAVYRFAGPAIGMLFLLSIYLLLRRTLKHPALIWVLFLLLASPIYGQYTLQTISFFSSSLSFILFAALLYLIYAGEKMSRRQTFLLNLLFSVALALTVPYFFVQYIPVLIGTILIAFIFRRRWDKQYVKYLTQPLLIAVIGLMLSFGHVFLQSAILKRYSGFPGINVATTTASGELVLESNYGDSDALISTGTNFSTFRGETHIALIIFRSIPEVAKVTNALSHNQFIQSYLLPIYRSGLDWIQIKNIRTVDGILAIGSYIWMAISIGLFAYALVKRRKTLFIIAAFSLVFGLSTQTGVFELTLYRGRSGWYLMYLSILGIVYALDEFYQRRNLRLEQIVMAVLILTSVFSPPQFYRTNYIAGYKEAYDISQQFPKSDILFLTTPQSRDFTMVSERLKYAPIGVDELPKRFSQDEVFIVLQKHLFPINAKLAQTSLPMDNDFSLFNKAFAEQSQDNDTINAQIKSAPDFSHFKLFWEDNDLQFYRLNSE